MIDWFEFVIYATSFILVGLYAYLYAEVQNLKEDISCREELKEK